MLDPIRRRAPVSSKTDEKNHLLQVSRLSRCGGGRFYTCCRPLILLITPAVEVVANVPSDDAAN
jgi:hypothetical protein